MKKIIGVFLTILLCLGLSACGNSQKEEESLGDDKAYLGDNTYRLGSVVFEVPEGVELDRKSTSSGLSFRYGERILGVKKTSEHPKESDEAVRKSIEEWAIESNNIDKGFEIIEAKVQPIADVDAMTEEYRYLLGDNYSWIRKITLRPNPEHDSITFATTTGGEESDDKWKVIDKVVDSIKIK